MKSIKRLWQNFKISFSMYSKIPMPKADWEPQNMAYVLCFFPLIGICIGAVLYGWLRLAGWLETSELLKSAVAVLIPVLITGGIHLDGLLDTADALSSYQSRERKLEIMNDPHTGAFAVIVCGGYFLLALGIWSEVDLGITAVICVIFVISRALSGLAVVTFPLAKETGLAATFSGAARKKRVKWVMVVYLLLAFIALLLIRWDLGIICIISSLLIFRYYRHVAVSKFGGLTGDLAGFFVQICELGSVAAVVVGNLIIK